MLGRTPIKDKKPKSVPSDGEIADDNKESGQSLVFPSGKLAAVTRKKNELSSLMNTVPPIEKAQFQKEFASYCDKVDNLLTECMKELQKENVSSEDLFSFLEKKNKIDKDVSLFRDEVSLYLQKVYPTDILRAKSLSGRSGKSGHSNQSSVKSSVHSLKVKLAEQRAQREAEESYLKNKEELDKKKAQLEKEMAELELQRKKDIEENLKKEIDAMEDFDAASSIRSAGDCEVSGPFKEVIRQQNEISLLLLRNQEKALLPKNEPKIFDGSDLTQFKGFLKAFEMTIEARCDKSSDKLFYLEKYTDGNPKKLVQSCFGKNPDQGYKDAMELLKTRYGNEFKIGEAYLKEIEKWPNIKGDDPKSLEELSVYLTSCANAMKDVSVLNQLNSPKEIMNIIRKLPYKLREKWRARAHDLIEKDCCVNFKVLVKFVNQQASIINIPVFGQIKDEEPRRSVYEKEDQKKSVSQRKKAFSMKIEEGKCPTEEKYTLSSSVSNQNFRPKLDSEGIDSVESTPSLRCECCKKANHLLNDCIFFGKKSHDEKLKFIKDNNLCFSCLKGGHRSAGCMNRLKCQKCQRRHPTSLHNDNFKANEKSMKSSKETHETVSNEQSATNKDGKSLSSRCQSTGTGGMKTACAVLPVKLRVQGTKNFVTTYMALDNFSTDCFIDEKMLDVLNVNGKVSDITLTTMENVMSKYPTKVVNNLEVYDLDENESKLIPVTYSTAKWPFSPEDSPKPEDVEKISYLQDVPFRYIKGEIGILIGANMPGLLKPLKVVDRGEDEPYATLHKLGWALNGPISPTKSSTMCHRIRVEGPGELENKIDKLFAQDFKGCQDDELGPSIDDAIWDERVNSSLVQRDDGHYEIGLPFRKSTVTFPDNKDQALCRLMNSKRKFLKNQEYFEEYKTFMNSMVENNFSEMIPQCDLQESSGKYWYLLHHGVYHPQKNKLRVVFDCSLKYKGVSLNDELLQGPDLTNNLLGVLLRFRQNKIAILADIEKMFYQVKVPQKDSNFLRYWWFPNGDLSSEPAQYRLTVHVFGAKSSPSCASFALKQTAKFDGYSEAAKQTVKRDFYVDDLVKSVNSPQQAVSLISELQEMLSKGGFNLTGFISNSREVLSSISHEKLSSDLKDLDITKEDLPYERALGVKWNVETDCLGFKIKFPNEPYTKRGVLSTIFSIYDPFGFAAPAILPGKRIFQQACVSGLDWDAELPIELAKEWQAWLEGSALLQEFIVPRCLISTEKPKSVELHVFCDGSEVGYGTAAYLRIEGNDCHVSCTLIMAKSRLVPAGKSALSTIPRIELTAAHLSVKITNILRREMEIDFDRVYFWTDSTTVLKYLNNTEKRFQRFVTNKVAFIGNHTEPAQWRHVPSEDNPADLASRGTTTKILKCSREWLQGPLFLKQDSKCWPSLRVNFDVEDCDPEVKKCMAISTEDYFLKGPTLHLLESCSEWHRTKRRVAWMLRLKNQLRGLNTYVGNLSLNELQRAEVEICKLFQASYFHDIIATLKSGNKLSGKHNLASLNPYVDELGLLRVGGRLSRAEISFDTKYPIIVPKNCHFAVLLLRDTHSKLGHLGVSTMLSSLRQKYWIVGARVMAKRLVHECVPCRRRHGRTSSQLMADLPRERLTSNVKPFTNVGLDCFGPIMVSRGRGRSIEKRYGLIFTCLSSRAVHIEVLQSLDTDSFLSALSRFMARRGAVKMIRSDNGTNFTSGHRELKDSVSQWNKASESWLQQRGVEWKFQPPFASHFGGVWEREIRTIRQVLDGLLNEQRVKMSDERLSTLMCEIENILNNRPLTELSNDPNDLEPLTPNHLLLADTGVTFPPGLFNEHDLYAKRRWRQVQYLADVFWSRWRKEYLPLLQKRQKWTTSREPHRVGDLVLVVDQLLPRNQWSTGRIVEVIADSRGSVRSAKVAIAKIKRDKSKLTSSTVIVERPIVKLILLRSFSD